MYKKSRKYTYLNSKTVYNFSIYNKICRIDEAFVNDVKFGDSWVGRWLNNLGRKVQIKVNLNKIESLSVRLKALFDELVDSSKVVAPYGVKELIQTSFMLGELEDAIERDDDVELIINILIDLELQIKSYELEDKEKLIDVIVEFRMFLEGLLKNREKDVEGEEEKEDEEDKEIKDDEDEEPAEEVDATEKVTTVTYQMMLENLRLLKLVLDSLTLLTIEGEAAKSTLTQPSTYQVGDIVKYKEDNVEKLLKILSLTNFIDYGTDKKYLTKDDLIKQKLKKGQCCAIEVDKIKKLPLLNIKPVIVELSKLGIRNESIVYLFEEIEAKLGTAQTPTAAPTAIKSTVVPKSKPSSVSAILKVRTAKKELVDLKIKGVSVSSKLISNILAKKKEPETEEQVKKLYDLIFSYLLGEKKSFLNPDKRPLVESVEILKSKTDSIAFKIAKFSYVLLKFNDQKNPLTLNTSRNEGLYKDLGEFGKVLQKYNKSLSDILKIKKTSGKIKTTDKSSKYEVGNVVKYKTKKGGEVEKEITKIEGDKFYFLSKTGGELSSPISNIVKLVSKEKIKKESLNKVENYSKFYRIFEKTSNIDYNLIGAKYDELFTDDLKEKFYIPDDLINKIEGLEEADTLVITNADSIIEIVRLFQRAWRIHTPGRIPGRFQRTDGSVTAQIFSEYEFVGSGEEGSPDKPGNGPYRNIELFEKWQDAVFDILSNTKYTTTIFSPDTRFAWSYGGVTKKSVSIKNISSSSGTEKQEYLDKANGKILLNFMNRMLNDGKMYGVAGGRSEKNGALYEFLNEYFDLDDVTIKGLGGLSYPGTKDLKDNANSTGGIRQSDCVFSKDVKDSNNRLITDLKNYLESRDIVQTVFKIGLDSGLRYYQIIKKDRGGVWLLDFDGCSFDPSTLIIKPNRTPISEVNLLFMEDNQFKNFKRGGNFTVAFYPKISEDAFDGSKETKTMRVKGNQDIEFLVNSDDKKINKSAKVPSRIKTTIIANLNEIQGIDVSDIK